MSDPFNGKIPIFPRKTMVLFFIVDTSGSMEGKKIGAVNQAIREVLPELKDMSDDNADSEIKIAVLEFSSGSRWITPPVEPGKYTWRDLDAAGVTDFGHACRSLAEKLSVSKGFMSHASGSYAPVLFLLSDGQPVDDWKSGLAELQKNNWYKFAVKVAIAIGDDADKDVLKEFTGSMEAVMINHDSASLIKMIKEIAVTSSQVASQGADATDSNQNAGNPKQGEVNKVIQEVQAETDAASTKTEW